MSHGQIACAGKVRFETFEQANRVARRARRRKNAARQNAYHCPDCAGFHVGTNPSRRAQRRALST